MSNYSYLFKLKNYKDLIFIDWEYLIINFFAI